MDAILCEVLAVERQLDEDLETTKPSVGVGCRGGGHLCIRRSRRSIAAVGAGLGLSHLRGQRRDHGPVLLGALSDFRSEIRHHEADVPGRVVVGGGHEFRRPSQVLREVQPHPLDVGLHEAVGSDDDLGAVVKWTQVRLQARDFEVEDGERQGTWKEGPAIQRELDRVRVELHALGVQGRRDATDAAAAKVQPAAHRHFQRHRQGHRREHVVVGEDHVVDLAAEWRRRLQSGVAQRQQRRADELHRQSLRRHPGGQVAMQQDLSASSNRGGAGLHMCRPIAGPACDPEHHGAQIRTILGMANSLKLSLEVLEPRLHVGFLLRGCLLQGPRRHVQVRGGGRAGAVGRPGEAAVDGDPKLHRRSRRALLDNAAQGRLRNVWRDELHGVDINDLAGHDHVQVRSRTFEPHHHGDGVLDEHLGGLIGRPLSPRPLKGQPRHKGLHDRASVRGRQVRLHPVHGAGREGQGAFVESGDVRELGVGLAHGRRRRDVEGHGGEEAARGVLLPRSSRYEFRRHLRVRTARHLAAEQRPLGRGAEDGEGLRRLHALDLVDIHELVHQMGHHPGGRVPKTELAVRVQAPSVDPTVGAHRDRVCPSCRDHPDL
mmetsp:Transcript_43265/g.123782  ORF Transcript_43265/g.123782 Transcript_43265/m.123782 type:complete len:601 (-) Transcript_43265:525-2327(-)